MKQPRGPEQLVSSAPTARSRDVLKTAHREREFIETCLRTQQAFVIDKVNARRERRAEYIRAAKVPVAEEGFDVLYCVSLTAQNQFIVEPATDVNLTK